MQDWKSKLRYFPCHSVVDGRCTCGASDCSAGKHPRIPAWQAAATCDPEKIRSWHDPSINLAIACGAESDLFVLDVDGVEGLDSWDALVREHGDPLTHVVRTGKGFQLYFKHPPIAIKNAVRFRPGLDVRSEGGYVMAAGARHISGKTYETTTDCEPKEVPAWLIQAIGGRARQTVDQEKVFNTGQRNDSLFKVASKLRRTLGQEELLAALVEVNRMRCKPPLGADEVELIAKQAGKFEQVEEDDGSGWRKSCFTFAELPQEKPRFLIDMLVPERALTLVPAPSYTGKSHFVIQACLSLAAGEKFLDWFEAPEPVPVVYHVPEMHAALMRDFMHRLGAGRLADQEKFVVRPLECDVWQLDSPSMVESSKGRVVVLDTMGYFNPGDDVASYQEAIKFSRLTNALIRQGAKAVIGLYHPPKYSKKEDSMSLENMILGSAGYGGVLRSCLGMRNLNSDPNDGLWLYVQGLKNPGLKPFQTMGVPLKMHSPPGESPYLHELMKNEPMSPKEMEARELFERGVSQNQVAKQIGASNGVVNKWHKSWKAEKDRQTEFEGMGV